MTRIDPVRSVSAILGAALAFAACARPEPLEHVLVATRASGDAASLSAHAADAQIELDAEALRAWRAATEWFGVELAIDASTKLWTSAELRRLRGLLAWSDAWPDAGPGAQIASGDRLPPVLFEQVGRLAEEGLALAERALERQPARVDALQLRAQHLELIDWAARRGPGAQARAAAEAALRADPFWGDAAPLWLAGRTSRFSGEDGAQARSFALLQSAVDAASNPRNLLEFGDVAFGGGQPGVARDAWHRASRTAPDAGPNPAPRIRAELAGRRWEALEGNP